MPIHHLVEVRVGLLMANVSLVRQKVDVVSNDWMLVPLPNSVIPAWQHTTHDARRSTLSQARHGTTRHERAHNARSPKQPITRMFL
jgi:hypothetical protein